MQREIKTAPRQSLADQVYEEVLSRILNLDLKPKQQVSAGELAEELGVSRTPLREAFQKLEGDGFLDIVPQSASVVAPLRLDAFRKAQFLREAIEVALVKQAVALADTSALAAALEREIKLQTLFVDIGDEASFFRSDEKFHKAIAEHCGIPSLWPEMLRVKMHLDRFRHIMATKRETGVALEHHRAIAEAIGNKDEAGAVQTMTRHLRRANHLLEQTMEQYPDYFD